MDADARRTGAARAARPIRLALLALIAHGPAAAPARAQWGYGGYGGIFTNPMGLSLQTQGAINTRSNLQGSAAYASRSSIGPGNLGSNPNYFYHSMRDDSFFQRYDPATRQLMEDRVRSPQTGLIPVSMVNATIPGAAPAPRPAPARPPAATTTAAAATAGVAGPALPLASFFNKYEELVWPSEAPIDGDLKARRTTSDAATLAALKETQTRKVASMASVTDARNKLLAYGRPALQVLRETSTPRVADSFHLFLLSLYESLAQAAIPPRS